MSAAPEQRTRGGAPPGTADAAGTGDAQMRASVGWVFGCGVAFAVVAAAAFGVAAGLGVFLGGALATVNLVVFARVVKAFLAKKGNTAPWGVVATLKMVLLFGGVWLILRSGLVSPLSLAAGYAALPFGITLASLFGPSPPETDLPAPGRDVVKGRRSETEEPRSDAPEDDPPQ